jgi:hypothetical protein
MKNMGDSQMLTKMGVATSILILLFSSPALPQSSNAIAGQWTVTWLGSTAHSQNGMTLTSAGDTLSGSYINDVGTSCPVSGNYVAANSRLTLRIACPQWSIDMEGDVTSNGKLVKGHYRAYANAVGQFQMEKP